MVERVSLGNNTQLLIDKGGAIWVFGLQMPGATVRFLTRMRESDIANIDWAVCRVCSILCYFGLGEWLEKNKTQAYGLIVEAMQKVERYNLAVAQPDESHTR
jgi:hypothetical protein